SGSIALLEDRTLVSEWSVGNAGRHAIWLLPAVKSHLENAGLDITQIDLFAVAVGPGSFTGLRIGISTVKGLAWPLGKKAIGVSTLAALAMNVPFFNRLVCPVLDARKGEVYAALYDTSGGFPIAVLEDAAMTPAALIAEISKRGIGGTVVFLGSGLDVYSKQIEQGVPGAVLAPGLSLVRASVIGSLGFERSGEAVDPAVLTPAYLRRSEAEIKFG
ncbi:MAG: tRNA (adenosine(37)-N6)-threonylcarbamoyltransferase complex dimerization subunit type 1 TsaB, partial [Deltaproteobacteria bacterium]|nr:tRNA (adenosine(37)-N6)-threonylcarbamoyltransferase complex dimerization subunit type 1 TsaB [Deltaproteobacteria bacterium]